MVIRKRTSSLRHRTAGLAALGLLAASTLIPTGAATAAQPPDSPAGSPLRGVSSHAVDARPSPPPSGGMAKLGLRRQDSGRSGILDDRSGTLNDDDGTFTCDLFTSASQYTFGYDGYLEEVASVLYSGSISCDAQLQGVTGDVALYDRTLAYNGETFSGRMLGDVGVIDWLYGGSGSGQAIFEARYYNGGRLVEPITSLYVMAPIGMVWISCDPGFLTRIYSCSGYGSSFLSIVLGGPFQSTGLQQACRDQNAALDPEEARLTQPSGSTPFSTQSLNSISTIRQKVIDFKRDLCNTTSAGASAFASSQGQQLWNLAVTEARNPAAQGTQRENDDRPLYWARLSMTAAIQQWQPSSFTISLNDRAAYKRKLDWTARGIYSSDFELNTAKKVFVTGFDPFGFDDFGVEAGNPSAASVLRLDKTKVNGAEVQVVIFPVRYNDFDDQIVETAATPHLQAGTQRADLITTVSQGGSRFDLEVWNGRNRSRRSDNVRDNQNVQTPGTFSVPVEPPNLGSGEQFTISTLPLDSMLVGSFVAKNSVVYEQTASGSDPQRLESGPTLCPTSANPLHPCNLAVEGSGQGFLSNEVAYRVTALRDRLGSSAQAGHVHTPFLTVPPTPAERNTIVAQYRQILEAAIGPASVCGEPQCVPVQGAYISHFTGLGCTGTESYYTPYFGSDGIRRSWNGTGLVGTILRRVTNRSWRGSDGQCHDAWINGNTLDNFVTVYR